MPQMQVIRGGQMNPNPLNTGFRNIGEQMARNNEREALNTERRALIEGERAYASGQLREQRAHEEAQYQQQLEDQKKLTVAKAWFEQTVQFLNSGRFTPPQVMEGMDMAVNGYLSMTHPITGETKTNVVNQTVPKLLGQPPIGTSTSSAADSVVNNAERKEQWKEDQILKDAAGKTPTPSQFKNTFGDWLRKNPGVEPTKKPGEIDILEYKTLVAKIGAARDEYKAAKAQGEEGTEPAVEALRSMRSAQNELDALSKRLGRPSVNWLDSLKSDAFEANESEAEVAPTEGEKPDAFDLMIQIQEMIKNETDPAEKTALQRMLKETDIPKMRKAVELNRG
jgi:hypothetical protein